MQEPCKHVREKFVSVVKAVVEHLIAAVSAAVIGLRHLDAFRLCTSHHLLNGHGGNITARTVRINRLMVKDHPVVILHISRIAEIDAHVFECDFKPASAQAKAQKDVRFVLLDDGGHRCAVAVKSGWHLKGHHFISHEFPREIADELIGRILFVPEASYWVEPGHADAFHCSFSFSVLFSA